MISVSTGLDVGKLRGEQAASSSGSNLEDAVVRWMIRTPRMFGAADRGDRMGCGFSRYRTWESASPLLGEPREQMDEVGRGGSSHPRGAAMTWKGPRVRIPIGDQFVPSANRKAITMPDWPPIK